MTVNEDDNVILLVGGISSKHGFSGQILEYSLSDGIWRNFELQQDKEYSKPLGIYGHSTVYHSSTRTFYIYGGMTYYPNVGATTSSKLFKLHYPTKQWSQVPIYSSQAHPQHYNSLASSIRHPTPLPSLFHSSVTSSKYMVVLGGQRIWDRKEGSNEEPFMSVYVYRCNLWINIYNESPFVELLGKEVDLSMVAGGAAGMDHKGQIYVMGGINQEYGIAKGTLFSVNLPKDSCSFYASAQKSQVCKTTLGCAHCSIYDGNGNNSTFCYSNDLEKVKNSQKILRGFEKH